jgi:hypothetical protein
MTKPHEKTWKAVHTPQGFYVREPSDRGVAYEPSVCMVYTVDLERLPDESGAEYFRRTEEATASVSSLISAAPDMARVMLLMGWGLSGGGRCWCSYPSDHTQRRSPLCVEATAALKKAGLL